MLAEVFNAIRDAVLKDATAKVVEMHGKQYSTHKLYDMEEAPPRTEPLDVGSLEGFCEGIKGVAPGGEDLAIHLASPNRVSLVGALHEKWRTRETLLVAGCSVVPLSQFTHGMRPEDFIVQAQTHFMPSDELARIMTVVSHLHGGTEVTSTDNGLSQRVSVEAGVRGKAWGEIKNPFILQPYRTFREVEQPKSTWLLRVSGDGSDIYIKLHEMDPSGGWTHVALDSVRRYLVAQETGLDIIG